MKFLSKNPVPLFLMILLVVSLVFFISDKRQYHMNIYINTEPSEIGLQEVKKCYSFFPDFQCVYKHSEIGGYYTKAVTYKGDMEMSDSDWRMV